MKTNWKNAILKNNELVKTIPGGTIHLQDASLELSNIFILEI